MLKPLFWMFKEKDFVKHFFILFFVEIFFLIAGITVFYTLVKFFGTDNNFALLVMLAVIFIIPFLFMQGYFWELTENVINREIDITTASVYNGKINQNNIIKLPKIEFFQMIWRGIASIVASLIFFIPIAYALTCYSKTGLDPSQTLNYTKEQVSLIFTIFISCFIPALLYNYASRNSVFAMLNIPKAVFIMGNYTWSYIKNTFLFILFSAAYSYIMGLLLYLFNTGIDFNNITAIEKQVSSINTENIILPLILTVIITFVFRIYFIYVNSYLLGTIAPRQEY